MISETGTLPPPRTPLTDREKFLLKRLIEGADELERALEQGIPQAIRMLAILGHDFVEVTKMQGADVLARTYVKAYIAGLRRAAMLVDAAPQGIA